MKLAYSAVSNKRGGLQILEKIKVKLGCIDEKPEINCVKLNAFINATREKVNLSRSVRNQDHKIIKNTDFQPFFSQNK